MKGKGPAKGRGKGNDFAPEDRMLASITTLQSAFRGHAVRHALADTQWNVHGIYEPLDTDVAFEAAFRKAPDWPPGVSITKAAFSGLEAWRRKRLKDWLSKPLAYKFPHRRVSSPPIQDMSDAWVRAIDWSSAVGVEKSGEGTEGVMFVELPGQQAVVVKSPKAIAAEILGTWMCEYLEVRVPRLLLVRRNTELGQRIEACLQKHVPSQVNSFLGSKAVFLVYEYVPTPTLEGIDFDEARGIFFAEDGTTLKVGDNSILHKFGRFLAVDVIMNNWDRLPIGCVWQNGGNLGNVMLDTCGPVAIDNTVACPKDVLCLSEPVQEYMERITELTHAVARRPHDSHEAFERLRTLFRDGNDGWHGFCKVVKNDQGQEVLDRLDIGPYGVLELQNGFMTAMSMAVNGPGGGQSKLMEKLDEWRENLLQDMKEMFREDEMRDIRADEHQNRTGDLWGFEKINIKFLNFVLDTFDSALEQEERPSKQALNAEPVVMLDDGMLVTITCNKRTPFLPLDLLASQDLSRIQSPSLHSPLAPSAATLMATAQSLLMTKKMMMTMTSSSLTRTLTPEAVQPQRKEVGSKFHELKKLLTHKKWPTDVDPSERQKWLSPEEFLKTFCMTKEEFEVQPKWKRIRLKKEKGLF